MLTTTRKGVGYRRGEASDLHVEWQPLCRVEEAQYLCQVHGTAFATKLSKIEVKDLGPLPEPLKANNRGVNLLSFVRLESGAELVDEFFLKRLDECLNCWWFRTVICYECYLHSLTLPYW